ncbi:MAG: TonB family protein [Verrucomicrobia bacterium]|nr:TonB family protein [Verrucomicrobiota bacterium]
MNRLERKCLLASSGLHALLLILLISGTAFITPAKKPVQAEQLRVVPTRLIDAAFSGGGGDPTAPRADAQVQGQPIPPKPAPPAPKPEPPAPKPEPPAPKPEPPPKAQLKKEVPRVSLPPTDDAKKTAQPKVTAAGKARDTAMPKIELKPVKRSQSAAAAARAKAEARAWEQAARQQASRIGKVVSGLQRAGFEQGTVVAVHGPGGEAYGNYGQFVKSVYEDAWVVTGDFEEETATAQATVVIARDGNVISSHLSKRSGNALLDRSVQAALNKVRFVAPFPDGAREHSRTFVINFNLNAKRLAG